MTHRSPESEPGWKQQLGAGAVPNTAQFILWSLATLGLYQVYWGWTMWEMVRISNKETYRFSSALRALFLPVSCFWLFPQIRELAENRGLKTRIDGAEIAGVFLFLRLLPFAVAQLSSSRLVYLLTTVLYSVVSALVLLPMLRMQHYYASETAGKYMPYQPNRWFATLLVILLMLNTLGILLVLGSS